jgi:hypothetical protein
MIGSPLLPETVLAVPERLAHSCSVLTSEVTVRWACAAPVERRPQAAVAIAMRRDRVGYMKFEEILGVTLIHVKHSLKMPGGQSLLIA